MASTVDIAKMRAELGMDTTGLDQGVAKAQKSLKTLDTSFQKTQIQIKNSLTNIDKNTTASTKQMTSSIRVLREHTEKEFVKTRKAIESLSPSITKVNNSTKSVTNAVKSLSKQATEINNSVKGVTESVKSNTKAIADMESSVVKSVNNISKSLKSLNTINENKLAGSIKKAFTNTKGDVLAATQAIKQFRKELAIAKQEAGRQGLKTRMYQYNTLSMPNVKTASDVKFPVYQAPKTPIQATSVKTLNVELEKANTSLNSFWGTSNSLFEAFSKLSFKIFLIRQGLMQIGGMLESILSPALNFTMEMETNQVGMAGILTSMTRINGKMLDWNDAMGISKTIIADLNEEAVKTAATSEELINTFRALLGPGLGAGMTLDQIKEFTVVGVNAVKSLGLDGRQLIQELRDLVQGGIQPASSTLATSLGLKDSDIKAAKNSAEGLFAFLMKRMEGFKFASKATGSTFKGVLDQIKEGYTLISAQTFSPLIEEIRSTVKSIRDSMLEIDDKGNATGFSKSLIESLSEVGEVAANFYRELKKIVIFLIDIGNPAFKLLAKVLAFVANNFSAFMALLAVGKLATFTKGLFGIASATDAVTMSQSKLGKAIKLVDSTFIKSLEAEKLALKDLKEEYNEEMFFAKNAMATVKAEYDLASIKRVNEKNADLAIRHLQAGGKKAEKLGLGADTVEFYYSLAEQLGQAENKFVKLGMNAEDSAKVQAQASQLVIKGKVKEAKSVLETAEAHATNAKELKGEIDATKESIAVLEQDIARREKQTKYIMGLSTSLVALGITMQAVSSIFIDSDSEISKSLSSVTDALVTAGIALGGLTQLYITAIPAIKSMWEHLLKLKVVSQLAGAFDAAKVAGAGFVATLKGFALPILGIGAAVGAVTASLYALVNGVTWAEAMSRYFDNAEERKKFLENQKNAKKKEIKNQVTDDIKKRYEETLKSLELAFPKEETEKGKGVSNGASKQAKSAYKALESAYKQLEKLAKEQQEKLDIYYKNDLISTQNYIDNKYTLQKLLLESEIKNLEERKKVAEKLGQESDVENFNSKIATAKESLAGLGEKSRLESIEEYKKLEDRLDSIKSKYEDLYGVTKKAFESNLAKEFSKDITRVNAELETALNRLKIAEKDNNETEKSIWTERLSRLKETQTQIKKIIELKGLEREADLAQAEIKRIDLEIQEKYLDVQDKVNRLAQTQAEADGDLFLFRKEHMNEYIEQYTTLIAKYEDMANKAEDLATRNKYKQMALEAREALNELTNAVPPFQKAIKEQFIGSLSDAFQSMLWQEKTAKEALEDFAKSVLQTWSKKVFDEVATAMTDGLFNMFLPKSEKADAKGNKDLVNQKVSVKVNADITDFVNRITEQSVSLQQSFTERLIPAVNATAQTFEEAIDYIRSLIGTVPRGGETPTTGETPNLGNSLGVGSTGVGSTTSSDYKYTGSFYTGVKDFTSYTNKLNESTSNLDSEFVDITASLKKSDEATQANADAASQAGDFAIPMMITSLLSASGVLGKFGIVLQGVMMAMQIAKATGILGFAEGGYVSGSGTATSDSIPARLSNGEYVLKASSVKALGTDFLDTLNNVGGYTRSSKLPKFAFADGGYVNANQNNPQEVMENIPKTIQSSPQVVMNMTFQSLDPESNMKMMEAQYPSIRNRLIRDLQSNSSMRTAVKGASK